PVGLVRTIGALVRLARVDRHFARTLFFLAEHHGLDGALRLDTVRRSGDNQRMNERTAALGIREQHGGRPLTRSNGATAPDGEIDCSDFAGVVLGRSVAAMRGSQGECNECSSLSPPSRGSTKAHDESLQW